MKLVYISGTRADFGLMRSLLEEVHSSSIDIVLCLTGTHFDESYGDSISEVYGSSIPIIGKVKVPVDGTKGAISKALSIQVLEFSKILSREQVDGVILLGDRSEMLMAAVAAIHTNTPILHIHGGELSGTIDDSMRHAISKLSHIHFTSTDVSRDRLIKMGEEPTKVFCIGAPGLDDIINFRPEVGNEAWAKVGFLKPCSPGLLVFHPVVQDAGCLNEQFKAVLAAALVLFTEVVILRPNSDLGRIEINELIDDIADNPNVRVFSHLDRKLYLELLSKAPLIIGNSSSGIIEAASFGTPVVNIGDRQNLRERSENIFQAEPDFESIVTAGREAKLWKKRLKKSCTNVYGDGQAANRFIRILRQLDLSASVLKKNFYE